MQCHFIPNSHLDREWGLNYQQTRRLTVAFLDAVLDIFEKEPQYTFCLDSQTVPLEDYLEIRPEKREKIIRSVKEGRLQIGPWYTAPDCNCINGESIARNLLMGHLAAREFGPVMKVGYTPFGFGQVGQLPQIYRNFGIDTALFYRGVTKESAPEAEFLWEAPDGTRVLGCRFGHAARYNFYMFVWRPVLYRGRMLGDRLADWREGGRPFKFAGPADRWDNYFYYDPPRWYNPDDADRYFRQLIAWEREHWTTPVIPLMQGMDTSMPDRLEVDLVRRIQARLQPGEQVLFSSMPKFVAALKRHLDGRRLRILKGEMRQPGGGGSFFATLAGDVISTRPRQKQLSEAAERLLQRWTEPWAALAWCTGQQYPTAYLTLAWKRLLHCHAHDTIGGCGVDDVEQDAVWRLRQVINLCRAQLRDTLGGFVRRMDMSAAADTDISLIVYNPLPIPRTEVVQTAVDVPEGLGVVHVKVEDAGGRAVAFHEGRRRETEKVIRNPYDVTNALKCHELEISFLAEDVPPLGWKTFFVRGAEHHPARPGLAQSQTEMENEFLRVRFDDDGTLELLHKASGRTFENLHVIEDGGEAGEPWTRHAPACDRIISSIGAPVEISLLENTPVSATIRVRYVLEVPVRLEHDTMYWDTRRSSETHPLAIESDFTLRAATPYLEVQTRLNNQHRNHRLRVLFPTGLRSARFSYAEQAFDVVERIIDRTGDGASAPSSLGGERAASGITAASASLHEPHSAARTPVFPFPPFHTADHPHANSDNPTYPMLRFCGISDGEAGLAVLADGIREYEAKDDRDRTLALTLIRAFELALCTVSYRWERLPEMEGSQSLGPHIFRYALYPHTGGWEQGGVLQAAERFSLPLLPAQSAPAACNAPGAVSSGHPLEHGFLEITPSSVLLSALKKAENGRALIVRVFNPTEQEHRVTLKTDFAFKAARAVTMEEKPSRQTWGLKVGKNSLTLQAPPKKIISLKLAL
ncbi:MAG: alpha-mannosidase [Candidatus Sumerlaeia bacterium]